MVFKVSKFWSRLDKNFWHIKYKKNISDEIIIKLFNDIINEIDIDRLHITVWTNEVNYLSKWIVEVIEEDNKFTCVLVDKKNIKDILSMDFFYTVRFFDIIGYLNDDKICVKFNVESYVEYSFLAVSKEIDYARVERILNNASKE